MEYSLVLLTQILSLSLCITLVITSRHFLVSHYFLVLYIYLNLKTNDKNELPSSPLVVLTSKGVEVI